MADEMLKNAQPQELESQIGEEDGLKEHLCKLFHLIIHYLQLSDLLLVLLLKEDIFSFP